MNFSPLLIKSLFGFLFLLFLTRCGSPIYLDNASTETLTVEVEGKAYSLAGGEQKEVEIHKSSQHFVVKDATGKILTDTTFQARSKGLINAAKTEYVFYQQGYIADGHSAEEFQEKMWDPQFIYINDLAYYGYFKLSHSFYFDRDEFNFRPNQTLPGNTFLSKTDDFKSLVKVNRLSEFEALHQNNKLSAEEMAEFSSSEENDTTSKEENFVK